MEFNFDNLTSKHADALRNAVKQIVKMIQTLVNCFLMVQSLDRNGKAAIFL